METETTKPGYKRIDVGIIPVDWNTHRLGEIAEIIGGGTPSTSVKEYWDPPEIEWVTAKDISSSQTAKIQRTEKRISKLGLENSPSKLLPPLTTVIIARGATMGKCRMLSREMAMNQTCYGIVAKEKITELYLYYQLSNLYKQFRASAYGSVFGTIISSGLESMEIPLPPIEEQIAIAETISDAVELIETLDKLIEKKKNIKQGAMQDLLTGKRRLSGFTGKWEVKNFEHVMDGFASGQTPYRAKPEYYKGNIPWITSGELNYNIITNTMEKITPKAVHDTNLKIIPKGTFLFAITGLEAEGTRGSCAITGIEATTNQSCMALYPKKGLLTTDYLFHYYVEFGKRLALAYCQGTKQQSYTGATAKLLPIILPPTIEEQSAIAQVLSDMDAEIRELEKRRDKYLMIKKGMMQQLLTGSIRLR